MEVSVHKKLDDFFKTYKNQKYRKGEILVRADDEPTGVFYLVGGVVRRYAISKGGEELTINIFKPISYFPMDWAVNNSSSSHYYEAMTTAEVYRAPKDEVLKFIRSNNDVMFDLVSRIYKGLDGYIMRMEYLMAGNANSRLIIELLILARRFGSLKGSKTVVNLKVTEKDLASSSGMTRETVSREIQKLRRTGLVDYKKNQLAINDLTELEQLLLPV